MQRGLGLGYQSQWAQQHLPARAERNSFYTRVGRMVPPGKTSLEHLKKLDTHNSPDNFMNSLKNLF